MAVVVLPTPPFWLTSPRILPMAIQTKGKGCLRPGACTVENHANLWKASSTGGGENTANSCRGRVSTAGYEADVGRTPKGQIGGKLRDFREYCEQEIRKCFASPNLKTMPFRARSVFVPRGTIPALVGLRKCSSVEH